MLEHFGMKIPFWIIVINCNKKFVDRRFDPNRDQDLEAVRNKIPDFCRQVTLEQSVTQHFSIGRE
ncbi:MAG: hypothetical protein QNJ47_02360 [Nostocaceae cyanobacterium]|nr:hypothetical protein [Nostocaceae cyanobacterium]